MLDIAPSVVHEVDLFRIDIDPQHAHARARKLERKWQSNVAQTYNSDFHIKNETFRPPMTRIIRINGGGKRRVCLYDRIIDQRLVLRSALPPRSNALTVQRSNPGLVPSGFLTKPTNWATGCENALVVSPLKLLRSGNDRIVVDPSFHDQNVGVRRL